MLITFKIISFWSRASVSAQHSSLLLRTHFLSRNYCTSKYVKSAIFAKDTYSNYNIHYRVLSAFKYDNPDHTLSSVMMKIAEYEIWDIFFANNYIQKLPSLDTSHVWTCRPFANGIKVEWGWWVMLKERSNNEFLAKCFRMLAFWVRARGTFRGTPSES